MPPDTIRYRAVPTLLLLALVVLANGSASGTPPTQNCDGDPGHYPHGFPSDPCFRLENPHFDNTTSCDAATRNCETCYACCNGRYDGSTVCRCDFIAGTGMAACYNIAGRTQQTCRQGVCATSFACNGDEDIEHRLH